MAAEQKLHFTNTPWSHGGELCLLLKDLAVEYIFKGCQLTWGQRDVGKGLSIRKDKKNLNLRILALFDSIHCAKC